MIEAGLSFCVNYLVQVIPSSAVPGRKRGIMRQRTAIFCLLLLISCLWCAPRSVSASEWRTVDLPARPLNIAENQGAMWVVGADELIATSSDGGKTWRTAHLIKGGSVLLTIGFADSRFGYATGTGGTLLITKDGGANWARLATPNVPVIYAASFSDEKHGLIQTPKAIYKTPDGGTTWNPITIDLDDELKGFPYVRQLVALDANHMALVMGEGDSVFEDFRFLVTLDGGSTWKVVEVPDTGLEDLSTHDGNYWFAGHEVIGKDKPGGGYGVAVIMSSKDGVTWTHFDKRPEKEFTACNLQGCLFWDGAAIGIPPANPFNYWTFAPEKVVSAEWAVAQNTICSVGTDLKCAPVATIDKMPPYLASSSPITPQSAPPALNAPASKGLQCIACAVEHIIVTQDYQGPVDVELNIRVGLNGLVEQCEVVKASRPEIGDRIAGEVRNWIFIPYESDGAIHPVATGVKLRVQAVKSK